MKSEDRRPLVLHIITGLKAGGAELTLLKVATGTAAFRHVVVSLRDLGEVGPQLVAAGVPVVALNLPVNPVAGLRQLVASVREFAPSVIQGWMIHGNLAATAARVAARSSARLIWSIHQIVKDIRLETPLTQYLLRLSRFVSGRADAVIFCSEAGAADHAALGYAAHNLFVIRNGVDVDQFSPSPRARRRFRDAHNVSPDAVVFGMVARRHLQKNQAGFLKAANLLLGQNGQTVRFVLVGSGTEADDTEMRELIPNDAVDRRAILLGARSDLPELYPAFDVLVSPSQTEALPNVIGEAMACGVPCLVTDVGDCAWMVGDTGVVVPANDVGLLAAAMQALAGDPARRRTLSVAARSRAVQEFSLDTTMAAYSALYRRLLGLPDPGHASRSD